MKGYKCFCCDTEFYEHEAAIRTVLEPHWWLDGCPMEELSFLVCPECGCDDLEEIDIEEDEPEE